MRALNAAFPYEQRTTDLAVVETGLKVNVKTYIVMSADIYGKGTGEFNTLTIQVPGLIRSAIREGQGWAIESGNGVWNHVHVTDLALLYEIILSKLLIGEALPSGENGLLFSENGEHTWSEIAKGIAEAGFKLGKLKTDKVKSLSLEEASTTLGWGNIQWTESGFAST
jgi:nucleoside-diphosphate-sugar epimerase